MEVQPRATKVKVPKVGAGAAGAGSGTLLVLFAESLIEDEQIRRSLIMAAPSISVGVGIISFWLQNEFSKLWAHWGFRRAVGRAGRTIEEQLHDSKLSDGYKQELEGKLEMLKKVTVDKEVEKVTALIESSTRTATS